tara:strand:- start:69 stop:626 length:558 start_codon:yes stop_codon:yes gene_type:complete
MEGNYNIGPEFSRVFELGDLSEKPQSFRFTAEKEECESLAARFEQQSIGGLTASLVLEWLEFDRVLSVSGNFQANVVQTCVISLEPVAAKLNEEIKLVFTHGLEPTADMPVLEEAEPLDGEIIDLGELVAEELSLALDPYPRSKEITSADINLGPGVSFLGEDEVANATEKPNPFEVLSDLKPKS